MPAASWYSNQTLGTDRQSRVLDDVSFTAKPGVTVRGWRRVKSTIAHFATRLLDPDAGVVRLDGQDLVP
jgi:ABC-type multidrug transport system fused ATPase/permease subunit